MDERRKTYIDSRIRRGYINRTEKRLFRKVFLYSALPIAIGLIIYNFSEGLEESVISLVLESSLNGLVLGVVLGMIVSATHNLFRQQVLRNFTGTDDYMVFKEKELKNLYEKGLISESEYFDSLEN